MFENLIEQFDLKYPKRKFNQIYKKLEKKYPNIEDPWGLNLNKAFDSLKWVYPIFKKYFKVRVFGAENVGDENYMVISNHTGQIAIDGMLISTAFVTEVDPPRILRPMAERFVASIPFFGAWAAEGGAVLGDRQNCMNLLNKGESVLIFPEGVKGIAKSTSEFYKLQKFTRGFYRIALSTNTKILPVAVIGAEEFFPFVYQPKKLRKLLRLPSLPITPIPLPLPSPVDIYIGKPVEMPENLTANSPDEEIDEYISKIQREIKKMTVTGLKKRRPFWGTIVGKKNASEN